MLVSHVEVQVVHEPYHLRGRAHAPTTFIRRGTETCAATWQEKNALDRHFSRRARNKRWRTWHMQLEYVLYGLVLAALLAMYIPFAQAFGNFDDRRLTTTQARRWQGSFTADGLNVVFEEGRESGSHLIQITLQTNERTDLTPQLPPGTYIAWPVFSPDGRFLVATVGDHTRELYLYDAHGTELRRLTTFGCFTADPAFEGSGETLLFILDCEGQMRKTMRYSVVDNVIKDVVTANCKTPHPWRGPSILFTCWRSDGTPEIRAYHEPTSTWSTIVSGPAGSEEPVPLPGDRGFVYITHQNWGRELALWQDERIYRIAHDHSSDSPAVSADGRLLCFWSNRGEDQEHIYIAAVPEPPRSALAVGAQRWRMVSSSWAE
ncbi:MAG: hypothetical protein NVS4B8_29720 [Herpetosiphon sp.]